MCTSGVSKGPGEEFLEFELVARDACLLSPDGASDVIELGTEVVTEYRQRDDEPNGHECCDETIFDCGSALFVIDELVKHVLSFRLSP